MAQQITIFGEVDDVYEREIVHRAKRRVRNPKSKIQIVFEFEERYRELDIISRRKVDIKSDARIDFESDDRALELDSREMRVDECRALWYAVLADGIRGYVHGGYFEGTVFVDDYSDTQWFASDGEAVGSFGFCCSVLGLDADALRRAVIDMDESELMRLRL